MSSSNYYWSRRLVRGFGKMWFLIIPQEANSSGGGASLLGSVVNEMSGGLFPGGAGFTIIGKDFPEPNHLTTTQLLLKAIESHRKELKLADDEQIVVEVKYPDLNVVFEKSDALKSSVGNFPSLPVSFSIDYSRMEKISIQFGANTRKLFIPTGYLSRLKDFVGGDDSQITTDISIDKETIVHQILLTDRYSVTFESASAFDSNFEAAANLGNMLNAGRILFDIEQTEKKQVTVTVNDGSEYLIALKDIDWDDL
ncbi:MAG: hypothetical protein KME15_13830 [Drouetiella hepatica Uher 2000/2452]|jgi:hypothetical protein|uniref:Uncharacterized protein n=1 Tax=Drouetiella hepatica Uher 2000/2452 TaxID=904376 RepID=A0A951UMU6_9CYAN|nr:hypothetical protein [Drouetiella hepatica Uher 2000/2452]